MAAKKKKADVWMPLYVSDYLTDTMHLTTEQHGAYMLLLMACWKSDAKLPNDAEQLQSITRMNQAKWKASEHILKAFFYVTPEYWISNRVREELTKAIKMTEARAKAGTEAANFRWQNNAKRIGNA